MKNKKQKIALLAVGLLLVVAIVSGLVQPYMKNKDVETIGPGRLQQDGKIPVPDFRFTDEDGNTLHFDNFKEYEVSKTEYALASAKQEYYIVHYRNSKRIRKIFATERYEYQDQNQK